MLRFLLLFAVSASFITAACAQQVQTTLGDVLRRDIARVFDAKVQLTRSIAQMNAEFTVARKELATAQPGSAAHAQAQEKLSRLSLSKNLSLLSLYLYEGVTENSRKASLMPEVLGGAKVDGGIPKGALPAFETWVRSVRGSLGRRDGELMVLVDSPETRERLIKALVDSQVTYDQYLRQSQKALSDEAAAIEVAQAEAVRLDALFKEAKLPDGGIRLKESKTEPLMASFAPFITPPMGELRQLLHAAAKRGQQILICSYGPVPTSDNQEAYQRKNFWYRSAPENVDTLLKMDTAGTLRNLGSGAFTTCPPNSNDAEAARRTAFEAHPGAVGTSRVNVPRVAPVTPNVPVAPAESAYCQRQAMHLAESRRKIPSMPPSYARSVETLEREHLRRCR